jgi:uncharacterized protein YueI
MIWWEREIYIKILIEYQEQKKHMEMAQNYNLGSSIL